MKKIVALLLAFCLSFSALGVMADPLPAGSLFTEAQLIEGVGKNITTYGVYGDYSNGNAYLQTLVKLVEAHPELYTEIMKSLLSSVDKYGAYFTPAESAKLLESLSDTITGIGVSVTQIGDALIISQVLPNTPAERAGLKSGDRIISANGTALSGMDLDKATSYIKGPAGTTVSVVVRRDGAGEITFNIVRETIVSEPVHSEIIDNKIGYIEIFSFSTNTAKYVNSALGDFRRARVKNIIIDVRNNSGGYLNEAIEVADLFLPKKAVITSEDRKGTKNDIKYVATGPSEDYNIVVLMNNYSASASEVLAAALSENKAAILIGERSYGKGTVQTMSRLMDGGIIKYTTAFYLTPSGKNIEGIGLMPDVFVENTTKKVDLSQFKEPSYKKTFSVGQSSEEIKNVKEMLAFLGVYQGEINEYFDENMALAVSLVQKASGYLPQNGILDPATQIELLQILSEAEIEVDDQLEMAKQYFYVR
ncbi:MAG: S41 family peptidase [Clostridia bacterium]|nr:S41 family peptidase [Clostridia bacterium]